MSQVKTDYKKLFYKDLYDSCEDLLVYLKSMIDMKKVLDDNQKVLSQDDEQVKLFLESEEVKAHSSD